MASNQIQLTVNAENAFPKTMPVYLYAYMASTGDISYTGFIPFNTVEENIGNCWNNTSKRFKAPVDGIYLACFTYYSNVTTTAGGRPSLMHRDAAGGTITNEFINGMPSGSISRLFKMKAGEELGAGAYSASFPINIYTAKNHNSFTVSLVSSY